jgi:[ribosomal protein S5]-alanine N-acetyltransferase
VGTDSAQVPALGAAADDPAVETIRTPRLELVSMTVPVMRALQDKDLDAAGREVAATVTPGLADDLVDFLRYRLAQVEGDPSIRQWLGRLMVITDRSGERRVIGTIGFHGRPDEQGRLEVGYRVEAPYRRQGYAREAVRALIDWAASAHGIHRFIASISPTNEASLRLAEGFGFQRTGEHIDEIDGLEIEFETDWPRTEAPAPA